MLEAVNPRWQVQEPVSGSGVPRSLQRAVVGTSQASPCQPALQVHWQVLAAVFELQGSASCVPRDQQWQAPPA